MNEIAINTKNHVIPDNILFFKADINYSIAYYSDGKKEMIVKSLKHIELKLKQHGFYRIHRSYLVNLEYISQNPTGFDLEVQNNYVLTIARRKISGLKRKMGDKHQSTIQN